MRKSEIDLSSESINKFLKYWEKKTKVSFTFRDSGIDGRIVVRGYYDGKESMCWSTNCKYRYYDSQCSLNDAVRTILIDFGIDPDLEIFELKTRDDIRPKKGVFSVKDSDEGLRILS